LNNNKSVCNFPLSIKAASAAEVALAEKSVSTSIFFIASYLKIYFSNISLFSCLKNDLNHSYC
jgi:hypothetical protein